jgi:hypothetical protein
LFPGSLNASPGWPSLDRTIVVNETKGRCYAIRGTAKDPWQPGGGRSLRRKATAARGRTNRAKDRGYVQNCGAEVMRLGWTESQTQRSRLGIWVAWPGRNTAIAEIAGRPALEGLSDCRCPLTLRRKMRGTTTNRRQVPLCRRRSDPGALRRTWRRIPKRAASLSDGPVSGAARPLASLPVGVSEAEVEHSTVVKPETMVPRGQPLPLGVSSTAAVFSLYEVDSSDELIEQIEAIVPGSSWRFR